MMIDPILHGFHFNARKKLINTLLQRRVDGHVLPGYFSAIRLVILIKLSSGDSLHRVAAVVVLESSRRPSPNALSASI